MDNLEPLQPVCKTCGKDHMEEFFHYSTDECFTCFHARCTHKLEDGAVVTVIRCPDCDTPVFEDAYDYMYECCDKCKGIRVQQDNAVTAAFHQDFFEALLEYLRSDIRVAEEAHHNLDAVTPDYLNFVNIRANTCQDIKNFIHAFEVKWKERGGEPLEPPHKIVPKAGTPE